MMLRGDGKVERDPTAPPVRHSNSVCLAAVENVAQRSDGWLRWAILDGRLALFASWSYLAVAISAFALSIVPHYATLVSVLDRGGALGIPLPERPSIDRRLHPWPLREYRTAATR